MPELPEVQTLASQLEAILPGRTITGVKRGHPSLFKTPLQDFRCLKGRRITRLKWRGKYIQIDLSEDLILWIHLGMSGQLRWEVPPHPLPPHTHFVLTFSQGPEKLFYRDVRRFGRIALTPNEERRFPAGVRRLGLEPEAWQAQDFVSRFKTRRGRIKSLLLNQTLVAGLGNIYADESLHRAGIRPLRRAYQVGAHRLERLHQAICEVLDEAVKWGGSSIDDYLHTDGTKGSFQNFHRVYGRGGEACSDCGTLIQTLKLSGRTSAFCPACQR